MEADGTTGQDTNSGSGVKTGHIQDGAVTDAKITGPISSSKIEATGLDADTVDGKHASAFADAVHNHDSAYQKKYANEVVVAKSGADFTSVQAAIDSITDAGPSNRYRVNVKPGKYNESVVMKPYVDLFGSGAENTTIISNTVGSYNDNFGTVVMASNTNLENIAVVNNTVTQGVTVKVPLGATGVIINDASITAMHEIEPDSSYNLFAVLCRKDSEVSINDSTVFLSSKGSSEVGGILVYSEAGNATLSVRDVSMYAESTGPYTTGYVLGIASWGPNSFSIYDTTLHVSGNVDHAHAIQKYNSGSVTIDNVVAVAENGQNENNGLFAAGGTVIANNSRFISSNSTGTRNAAIYESSATAVEVNSSTISGNAYSIMGAAVKVGGSKIEGQISCSNCKIVNCWDNSFNPIANQ